MISPHRTIIVLLLCCSSVASLIGQQLTLGAIDQNTTGKPVGSLLHSFEHPDFHTLIVNDFGARSDKFLRFDGSSINSYFEGQLDDFDYVLKAKYGPFFLFNDRQSGVSINIKELDSRTGDIRTLFNRSGGLSFSAAAGEGYMYLDGNRNLYLRKVDELTPTLIANNIIIRGSVQFSGNVTTPSRLVIGTNQGYFISDGTDNGTFMLDDTPATTFASTKQWSDKLFILLGNALFVTDGTAGGSRFVYDPSAGIIALSIGVSTDGVVLVADEVTNGKEIWTTDGTAGGFRIVNDLFSGVEDGVLDAKEAPTADGSLLFRGGSNANYETIYQATATGSIPLMSIPSASTSNANWRIIFYGTCDDGTYFFSTNHLQGQQVLWRVAPGQAADSLGVFPQGDLIPAQVQVNSNAIVFQLVSDPDPLYYANSTSSSISIVDSLGTFSNNTYFQDDKLYYQKPVTGGEPQLRLLDLSTGVTADVGVTSLSNSATSVVFEYDDRLYALGLSAAQGEVVYDISDSIPRVVVDVFDYTESSFYDILASAEDYIYLQYSDGMYVVAPGSTSAVRIGPRINSYSNLAEAGDGLLLDLGSDELAWVSPTGVQVISIPQVFRQGRGGFKFYKGDFYFIVNRSDRNQTDFHLVKIPGDDFGSFETLYSLVTSTSIEGHEWVPEEIVIAYDRLYFPYPTIEYGWEVGESRGEISTTGLYKDILSGSASSAPRILKGMDFELAVQTRSIANGANLHVFYIASNRTYGYQVAALADRLLDAKQTISHTFLKLSQSTRSNERMIIVDNLNRSGRIVDAYLNTKIFSLPNERVAYWESQGNLFVTSGPEVTDTVYAGFTNNFGEAAVLDSQLVYTSASSFETFVKTLNFNTGTRELIPGVEMEYQTEFLATTSRVYFKGTSLVPDAELHYLGGEGRRFAGLVFEDINVNGTRDNGEPFISNARVEARGAISTSVRTNGQGRFELPLPTSGAYVISPRLSECYAQIGQMSYQVADGDASSDTIRFAANQVDSAISLRGLVTLSATRCNDTIPAWLSVLNTGCEVISGTHSILLPAGVALISAEQNPVSGGGGMYTWETQRIQPGASWQVRFQLSMPDENSVGDTLSVFAFAKTLDEVYQDTSTFTSLLRCAYDPNDKLVSPARLEASESNYTQFDETLTYTIRFQNTGNDTAINVRLVDELSVALDWSTFEPITASHAYTYTISDAGVLVVKFDDIFLPDSLSNQVESNGYFTFDIQQVENTIGIVIENDAEIYFDSNAPIVTNKVENTIVEFLDQDGDGYYFWDDCKDEIFEVNPGAIEIPNNGLDDDCDGEELTPVGETLFSQAVSIFPNPSSTTLSINYPGNTRIVKCTVSNLLGQPLFQFDLTSHAKIEVDQLPSGRYILQVMHPSLGKQENLVFIKQ